VSTIFTERALQVKIRKTVKRNLKTDIIAVIVIIAVILGIWYALPLFKPLSDEV